MAQRLLYANFLTADYSVLGVIKTFADCIENQPGFAIGGPNVDANGLVLDIDHFGPVPPAEGSVPQITGDMNTEFFTLFNTGFFLIMAIRPVESTNILDIADGVTADRLKIGQNIAPDLIDVQAPNVGFELTSGMNAAGSVSQFALLYDSTNNLYALSVNGGAVVQDVVDPQNITTSTNVLLFGGVFSTGLNGHILYFAAYPPTIDIALMPTYSTVGFTPPPSLGPTAAARMLVPELQIIPVPHNQGLWR